MALKTPLPLGISQNWMNKRDEEIAEAESIPMNILRITPAYQMLERQLEATKKQLAELTARYEELQLAKKPAPKKRKRNDEPRERSPEEIMFEGVRCVSVRHIHLTTGLDQSVISRQLAASGIKPKAVHGSKYYYPASQVSDIKRKKSARRR